MQNEIPEKINMFRTFNEITLKDEIVIYGSTYTADFPFYELSKKYLLNNAVYNRSIRGLTLEEAEKYLPECVLEIRPCKIFLALGDCDLDNPSALTTYRRILLRIREKLPSTQIYVLSVCTDGQAAELFNAGLRNLCRETGNKYLDIHPFASAPEKSSSYSNVFRRMTCYFRDGGISFADAFRITEP